MFAALIRILLRLLARSREPADLALVLATRKEIFEELVRRRNDRLLIMIYEEKDGRFTCLSYCRNRLVMPSLYRLLAQEAEEELLAKNRDSSSFTEQGTE